MTYPISFNGYFSSPEDSFTGGLLYYLKTLDNPDNPFINLDQKTSINHKLKNIAMRVIFAVGVLFCDMLDLLYWCKLTVQWKFRPKNPKEHIANLVSFIALPLLICTMPFGYLPKIQYYRSLTGRIDEMIKKNRQLLSYQYEHLPALIEHNKISVERALLPFSAAFRGKLFFRKEDEKTYLAVFHYFLKKGVDPLWMIDKDTRACPYKFLIIGSLSASCWGWPQEVIDADIKIRIDLLKMLFLADASFHGSEALKRFNPSYFDSLESILSALERTPLAERQGRREMIINTNRPTDNNPFFEDIISLLDKLGVFSDRNNHAVFRNIVGLARELNQMHIQVQKIAAEKRKNFINSANPNLFPVLNDIIIEYWDDSIPLENVPFNFQVPDIQISEKLRIIDEKNLVVPC